MACSDIMSRLDAYLDGELDETSATNVERHVATCPSCRSELSEARALSDAIRAHGTRFSAPEGLSCAMSARLAALPTGQRRARRFSGARLALAASLVLSAVLAGLVARDVSAPADESLAMHEVADSHRRSMSTGDWTDYATADRHALVSWARSQDIGFAPPIADLRPEGYTLVGGRREFVDGRPAIAIVYRRNGAVVDLVVASAPSALVAHARLSSSGRINVVDWTEPGFAFWAVSTTDEATLRRFHKSFEEGTHRG